MARTVIVGNMLNHSYRCTIISTHASTTYFIRAQYRYSTHTISILLKPLFFFWRIRHTLLQRSQHRPKSSSRYIFISSQYFPFSSFCTEWPRNERWTIASSHFPLFSGLDHKFAHFEPSSFGQLSKMHRQCSTISSYHLSNFFWDWTYLSSTFSIAEVKSHVCVFEFFPLAELKF